MNRPLLLIDVDGVISLFGFDPIHPPPGRFQLVDGIAHFLSAGAGPHLRALSTTFELAWCTGWEEKANDYLVHALGLRAPLPYLTFERAARRPDAHRKLASIDAYAGRSRPLAWIDDCHDERCASWAAARQGATLLLTTEPSIGLTGEHVEQLAVWAKRQQRSSKDPCLPAPARKRSRPS
jgi:hypothetical protein